MNSDEEGKMFEIGEERKEEIIRSLDYSQYPGFKSQDKLFNEDEKHELRQLSDDTLRKLELVGIAMSEYLPKRQPWQQQRRESIWVMLICLISWCLWKFTGFMVVTPILCVLGFFIGFCFFWLSYLLKSDSHRLIKKLSEMKNKEKQVNKRTDKIY